MARSILLCCVLLAGFLLTAAPSLGQATEPALSGTVTDASNGQPLAFANVILTQEGRSGILGGAATNTDGQYVIPRLQPGAYLVTIRFVGYGEAQLPVQITPGVPQVLDAELTQGGLDLNTIVITASRQAEKVLEAPASISVLDAREIEGDVVSSSVGVLRNLTGVDMAQTGVDRTEMVLRGFNNAFSGSAYILTDYRHSAVASLNVNAHNVMPNMLIDLERVEVVRGPGSALYGAGVDAGVVHYITKDPFNYPGTTLSIMGGEQSLLGAQLRHAGVIGENLGYKVTGFYSQADDWGIDPAVHPDSVVLNDEVLPRNTDFNKLNFNGTLQLRLGPRISITANGGYSELQSVLLSGIGALQAKGFGYSYGQLRLQANRFFAQVYLNRNNAGESFSYGLGIPVADNGTQLTAQAQYDWSLADDRVQIVLGGDLELTRPKTDGLILGRNELMDDINEIGGYTQATIELSRKIDITMAFRGDWSNIYDELQLSPRAALVYKVAPGHILRGSYNRSFSSPGVNSLFLDIIAQQEQLTPDPMGPHLLFMARGSINGTTFEQFRMNNTAAMFLPVENFFGNEFDVGNMPLVPIYGAAASGLVGFLNSEEVIPIPGLGLSEQQRGLLAELLGYSAGAGVLLGSNTTATTLGIRDSQAERGFVPVAGPVDIEPLKQTVSQSIEFGYKGLLTEKILFGVDAYFTNKKDFTGPLLLESPLVYLDGEGLGQDVGAALGSLFLTTTDTFIQQKLGELNATGLDPTEVTTILATLVGGSFNNQPIAVVQPDQLVLNPGDPNQQNAVGGFLGYRNFGDVDFWGIDTSLQILASESLTLFANASFIQGDFFQIEDLTNPNAPRRPALNAPAFKAKAGGSFRLPGGLSFSVSGRFVEGFPVRSGPFTGSIDSYTLLDAGLGYDFGNGPNGLRIDFSVQNVLDSVNRQFVGAPQIGRLALARLTYTGGAR